MKRFLLAFAVVAAGIFLLSNQTPAAEPGQGKRSGAERGSDDRNKGTARPGTDGPSGPGGSDQAIGVIDTHVHIARNLSRRTASFSSLAQNALRAMDQAGIAMSLLMPPPFPEGHDGAYGLSELSRIAADHPTRFAVIAGAESLNGMILATKTSDVKPQQLDKFRKEAIRLADGGIAGYGEFAVEHFSSGQGQHPYLMTAPDHPMLLALADVAAERGLPIDIHMEAVPQDMAMPDRRNNGENPPKLTGNIAPFERLLQHNSKAKIVWAHAGWDLSGERSVALMRRMLGANPNLFMSIKFDQSGTAATNPMTETGLKESWLAMLRAFPDRFVVGSDQFYDSDLARLSGVKTVMQRLPPDLALKIGRSNALAIYRIPSR